MIAFLTTSFPCISTELRPVLCPDPPLDEIEPAVCVPDPSARTNGLDRHNEEVHQFIQESVAKSTVYKYTSAEKRFTLFSTREMNPPETRSIEKIPAVELDRILCQFFMYAEKIDKNSTERLGVLYHPDSLSSFVHSWQRILSSRGSSIDLKHDKMFEDSRRCLAAKRKKIGEAGTGEQAMCHTSTIRQGSGQALRFWVFWYQYPSLLTTALVVGDLNLLWVQGAG